MKKTVRRIEGLKSLLNIKMKKLFLLLVLVVQLSTSYAQIEFGVNAGVNISDAALSLFNDIESKKYPLYFIGVMPRYRFGESFALISEVQYIAKGYQTNDFFDNETTSFKSQHLDFIPELEFKAVSIFRISAGANISYRFSNKMRIGQGADWTDLQEQGEQKWDFGLTAAGKLYFNNLFIVLRYKYGFTNLGSLVLVDQNGNDLGILGEYSRNILLGLGYYF